MSYPYVTPGIQRRNIYSGSSKIFARAEPTSVTPRSFRLLKLLQNRELGIGQSSKFPEDAYKMKVQDFEKIRSHRFGNQNEILHTAYFLRAGKNALIGALYVQKDGNCFSTIVAQLHYDLSRIVFGETAYIDSKSTVVDACQLTADPDIFISVGFVNKCTGEVQVATGQRRANNEYNIFKYRHPFERPFWCCNGNAYTEKFALGCDREICLYSVTGITEIRSTVENIYSLAYNDYGTVLHMGTEKGKFFSYDLRSNDVTGPVVVDGNRKLVDDVLVLSNGYECLVSGVTGSFKKVDLRVNRVVHSFPHHNRRSRRIPVSVNESFGLVCASGADDMTRLWCLKSGKLLHEFEAPSTYPARSCLVPECSRGVIHMIQDNFVHVYCMLR